MSIDKSGELFFDQYLGKTLAIMYSGIESTLKLESVHACALLLSTYTEILGGCVTGKLHDRFAMRENYETFLEYLGAHYVSLNEKYDLYSNVRSKLVHEFSPRPSYVIFVSATPNDKRFGVEITNGNLSFNLPEYYRDFKNAIANYRNQMGMNPMLIINLQRALSIDWNNVLLKPKNAKCEDCGRSWLEEIGIEIDGNTWAKNAKCPKCKKIGKVVFIDNVNDPTKQPRT